LVRQRQLEELLELLLRRMRDLAILACQLQEAIILFTEAILRTGLLVGNICGCAAVKRERQFGLWGVMVD